MEFLGPQLFESRVTLAYEQDEAPYHVQELSRREMFSHMTEGSRAGTKKLLQMLPGLRSEEDSAADFRLMLHQRTKQLKAASETPLRYGWYLPNFTQKCFGCGKCEKACRSGALKLEDMPDGQTRVVVTPWKCSECGVCVAACSNSGIDGMKLRQLTTLGPVSVYKCSKTLCADCGKPIAPNSSEGICSVCRIKRRTKQRQEEAAARARERIAEREARKAAEEAAKAAAAELAAENCRKCFRCRRSRNGSGSRHCRTCRCGGNSCFCCRNSIYTRKGLTRPQINAILNHDHTVWWPGLLQRSNGWISVALFS